MGAQSRPLLCPPVLLVVGSDTPGSGRRRGSGILVGPRGPLEGVVLAGASGAILPLPHASRCGSRWGVCRHQHRPGTEPRGVARTCWLNSLVTFRRWESIVALFRYQRW